MMDFSEVEKFAARLRHAAEVGREFDPILTKYGTEAGQWVGRYAPKRTRSESFEPVQSEPGTVTFPPYLVGEYKGTSQRGPNRRFLKAALNKVQGPFLDELGRKVIERLKG